MGEVWCGRVIGETEEVSSRLCPQCKQQQVSKNGRDRRGAQVYRCADGSVAKILFALFPGRSVLLKSLPIGEFRENKFAYFVLEWIFATLTVQEIRINFDRSPS